MHILPRILLIVFLLLFLSLATGYIYRFGTLLKTKGVPTINTFSRHYELLKQLDIPAGSSLIDLGCGTGAALRFFANNFEELQLHGVDLNRLAIAYGQRKNKKSGYTTISLQYQDIFTVNLEDYDYLYIFLMPNVMQAVEEWLSNKLPPHTTVIVNAFPLPSWKPAHTLQNEKGEDKVFLYRK